MTLIFSDSETRLLLEENRPLKEQTLCKFCLDNPVSIGFLPCGHLVCCPECALRFENVQFAENLSRAPFARSFLKDGVLFCSGLLSSSQNQQFPFLTSDATVFNMLANFREDDLDHCERDHHPQLKDFHFL